MLTVADTRGFVESCVMPGGLSFVGSHTQRKRARSDKSIRADGQRKRQAVCVDIVSIGRFARKFCNAKSN